MYAKFCGLGIHNCLLHARVVRLRAENKNVTELVAYRTIATTEQALELMVRTFVVIHVTRRCRLVAQRNVWLIWSQCSALNSS